MKAHLAVANLKCVPLGSDHGSNMRRFARVRGDSHTTNQSNNHLHSTSRARRKGPPCAQPLFLLWTLHIDK